jgi:hypothetical protein
MRSASVEVMGVLRPSRIRRYLSVLLADLVTQLVEIDHIENLSHSASKAELCAVPTKRFDCGGQDYLAAEYELFRAGVCQPIADSLQASLSHLGMQ